MKNNKHIANRSVPELMMPGFCIDAGRQTYAQLTSKQGHLPSMHVSNGFKNCVSCNMIKVLFQFVFDIDSCHICAALCLQI